MTVLLFRHEGWDVATAAWSAASEDGRSVTLCYGWGADTLSMFSSATSIRRATFSMKWSLFVNAIQHAGPIDLRQVETI